MAGIERMRSCLPMITRTPVELEKIGPKSDVTLRGYQSQSPGVNLKLVFLEY